LAGRHRQVIWLWPRWCLRSGQTYGGLRQSGNPGDFGPPLEGLGADGSILESREVIAVEVEEVVDPVMGGEETLHLPGRLEALHLAFSSSSGLVGVLRPVVQAFMLPVLNAGHDLPLCGPVAGQLVGDHHPGYSALLFQMGWTAPERH
jgi:hypothetical protein